MRDILEEIVAHKHLEVERMKEAVPQHVLERKVAQCQTAVPSMRAALQQSATGIIAETKRRSPSRGWIKQYADARVIPLGYQTAGATALSILTDTKYFGGSDDDIIAARQSGVTLPVLYKNFVVNPYQLFQARLAGASAVLLIAAAFAQKNSSNFTLHTPPFTLHTPLPSLIRLAHDLGLEVLMEIHSESELDCADMGADMIGVNNRCLGTFVTDVETSFRLSERLPADAVKVSESGLKDPPTLAALRQAGYRGFLMGERFMQEADPARALAQFLSQMQPTDPSSI